NTTMRPHGNHSDKGLGRQGVEQRPGPHHPTPAVGSYNSYNSDQHLGHEAQLVPALTRGSQCEPGSQFMNAGTTRGSEWLAVVAAAAAAPAPFVRARFAPSAVLPPAWKPVRPPGGVSPAPSSLALAQTGQCAHGDKELLLEEVGENEPENDGFPVPPPATKFNALHTRGASSGGSGAVSGGNGTRNGLRHGHQHPKAVSTKVAKMKKSLGL
ncbi:hypothetical protein V8C86DRAFT_2947697, partial [Haematococcus lacustris]